MNSLNQYIYDHLLSGSFFSPRQRSGQIWRSILLATIVRDPFVAK